MQRLTKTTVLAVLFILLAAIPALAASKSYIVKAGDTVDSIAKQFSISKDSLIIANSLGPVPLIPGQTLAITDTVARTETDTTSVSRGEYERQIPAASTLSKGEEIVAYAKQFVGRPYVYGANGPKSFDCSGFTSYVYRQYGFKLYRSAADQSKNGHEVSRSELQPGDLLFFHTTRKGISHAGMYIGNGKFIHASSGSAHAVTISPLNEGYYNSRLIVAKRIL